MGLGLGLGLGIVLGLGLGTELPLGLGWLVFMSYGPKLLELNLRSGGGFGNKNKIVQGIIHFVHPGLFLFLGKEQTSR